MHKSASDEDLKKAYRKLALKFHPDKNFAPGATDAFKGTSFGDKKAKRAFIAHFIVFYQMQKFMKAHQSQRLWSAQQVKPRAGSVSFKMDFIRALSFAAFKCFFGISLGSLYSFLTVRCRGRDMRHTADIDPKMNIKVKCFFVVLCMRISTDFVHY